MAKTAQLEFAEWARKDLLEIARYFARDNLIINGVNDE